MLLQIEMDSIKVHEKVISFAVLGVTITKDDTGNFYTKNFYSEGGIVEFVQMLDKNGNRNPIISQPLYVEGLDEASNVMVEVALTYNDDFKENIFSIFTIFNY
ncbi:MAG: hypothetical protein EBX13_02115 [Proteobacteria bacterium]|nr:hypothetical protein [Pseudomonadota bacterium]